MSQLNKVDNKNKNFSILKKKGLVAREPRHVNSDEHSNQTKRTVPDRQEKEEKTGARKVISSCVF